AGERSSSRSQVFVEPGHRSFLDVRLVVGAADAMSLVLVDDELSRHAQRLQRVPELVALRSGNLRVAIPVEDERRRLDVLDERNRRGPGVNLGIFVDGLAEIREHPLVDAILSVVALPVHDAGAGDRGFESVRLRDGPHRHVSAVAPADDAEALGIDGRLVQDFVHAREDVREVAVAEVLDVALRELPPEAVATARIWKEEEVALRREDGVPSRRPGGRNRRGRSAVDGNDHGITLRWVETQRSDEPALGPHAVALPMQALRLSPESLRALVASAHRPPASDVSHR